MKSILICGSSGFVGKKLKKHLSDVGYTVHTLDRHSQNHNNSYKWDLKNNSIDLKAFDNVDTIINLTGANIGEKRWTQKRKEVIVDSRVNSAKLLFNTIKEHDIPIRKYFSSSAVGYYGAHTSDKIFEESDPPASDFLGTTCRLWEEEALKFSTLDCKVVIFRKGVVLGGNGGIYKKLLPLAKMGINTCVGSGHQYLPWIHLEDMARLYSHFLKTTELQGIYNTVASQHITMEEFSKELAKSENKLRIGPNVPKFALKIAMGEMSLMATEGSRVSNEKLLKTDFNFHYDNISEALLSIKQKR